MSDLESKIASLSPAKRALLQRALRENVERAETDPVQRPQHWSSLIPVQPKGTRLPFFWIHGDSTNFFLPAALGPDQPLYGLEHQSLDGRPAHYTQVETIAKYYLEELRTVRPRGPYSVGGYCFGAIVAFEMAQQLKREGEHVALIFMLDPPGARQEKVAAPIQNEVQRHLRQLGPLGLGERMRYLRPRVSSRISERTTWIRKKLNRQRWRYCLWAGRLLPVSLRSPYILDVYRQATRSYKPQPYSGRIVLFKARSGSYQPPLNWVQLAEEIEIHEYPGDHMALREEPQVRKWARLLKESLDRAQNSIEKGPLPKV
jgi:thioesterase domain-containing protein